jgi:hypothetical protein
MFNKKLKQRITDLEEQLKSCRISIYLLDDRVYNAEEKVIILNAELFQLKAGNKQVT